MNQKQLVRFRDLGQMEYQAAWDLQEELLRENVAVKQSAVGSQQSAEILSEAKDPFTLPTANCHPERSEGTRAVGSQKSAVTAEIVVQEFSTTNYLLFTEHPPVYTLGKSGSMDHVLLGNEELKQKGIAFFHTNRGGDITYHGPGQVVGYPILDLEKFGTDIGKYLRNLEEVIILTLNEFGIRGERSKGETGVWIDVAIPGRERKICAIGVRCSRWITMHGFAFNVNTDLSYFNHIIPCGIVNKQVTSLEKELMQPVDINEAKEKIKRNFERVFDAQLI